MASADRFDFADEERAARAEFYTGEVTDLPEDARFDAATCLLVMHFLPDDGEKLELLCGIARRLAPGAPLVLADLCGSPGSRGFTAQFSALKQDIILRRGADPDEVDEGLATMRARLHLVPEARIKELLQTAGFRDVSRCFGAYLTGAWVAWRDGEPAG